MHNEGPKPSLQLLSVSMIVSCRFTITHLPPFRDAKRGSSRAGIICIELPRTSPRSDSVLNDSARSRSSSGRASFGQKIRNCVPVHVLKQRLPPPNQAAYRGKNYHTESIFALSPRNRMFPHQTNASQHLANSSC